MFRRLFSVKPITSLPTTTLLNKFSLRQISVATSYDAYEIPPENRIHAASSHPTIRKWHTPPRFDKSQLVYPIFVTNGETEAIKSMPDQYRWNVDQLPELLDPLVEAGLASVLLFGVPTADEAKDSTGSWADRPESPVMRSLEALKVRYPDLLLQVDICLCAYTHHGHCGIIQEIKKDKLSFDNTASVNRLAEMSVAYAQV